MYRAALGIVLLLTFGCGDADPIQKNGDGGGASNGVTFNNSQDNLATNNANINATTNGMTNNPDAPDPAFENPCESGPLAEPIPNCAPDVLPSSGDPAADCVRRINQFRWECQCLPPLERWTEGEQCADEHAEYDARNLRGHAGFNDDICSPRGNAQNECPDWNSWDQVIDQCLQMMWDEGPGENFQEHGHYLNMSNTSFSRVACGSGSNWYVQNFQ